MTNGIIRSQVSRRAARLAHSFIGATGVTSANLRASETKNNTQKIKYPDSRGLIGSLCCMRLKPHSAKLTSGVLLSRITATFTGPRQTSLALSVLMGPVSIFSIWLPCLHLTLECSCIQLSRATSLTFFRTRTKTRLFLLTDLSQILRCRHAHIFRTFCRCTY